jgi:hypothetical protein
MNAHHATGDGQMKPASNTPPTPEEGNGYERNRLEVIRFASRDDCRRAIGVLMERGLLEVSSNAVNVWAVRTNVVRALRQSGVPFEWLTENV